MSENEEKVVNKEVENQETKEENTENVVVEASANQEETEKVETTETTEVIEETKTENAPVEAVLETKEEEPVAETPVVEEEKVETKTEKEKPSVDKSKLLEEFDWNAHVSDEDQYSSDERNELKGIYEKTLSTISESETVDGKVVAMTKREIVVNIGYKSEGIINLNEFRYNPELQVGDKVEVYVDSLEDKSGQLILSHKKARAIHSWDRVNKALEDSEIIKGFIKCRTKGGMIVDVFGLEAFLPGSQIDVKPIRDYDQYVNKNMEFKVVKINHEFKNVVVSHKALIEADIELQKKEIIGQLEKGQVLEGTVKKYYYIWCIHRPWRC